MIDDLSDTYMLSSSTSLLYTLIFIIILFHVPFLCLLSISPLFQQIQHRIPLFIYTTYTNNLYTITFIFSPCQPFSQLVTLRITHTCILDHFSRHCLSIQSSIHNRVPISRVLVEWKFWKCFTNGNWDENELIKVWKVKTPNLILWFLMKIFQPLIRLQSKGRSDEKHLQWFETMMIYSGRWRKEIQMINWKNKDRDM